MHPERHLRAGRPAASIALAVLLVAVAAAPAQPPPIDCQTELLGSSTSGQYFAVDLATGAASTVAPIIGKLATELEFDLATDTLWFEEVATFDRLVRIDSVTGAELGSVTHASGALNGLEFVGSTLYGTFIDSLGGVSPSDLVTVDTTTGALTTLGATGFGPISGLAWDEINGVMYGISAGSDPSQLLTLDLATGAATAVGATGLDRIGSIEFGPDGNLYGGLTASATSNGQFLVRINTATGAATPIGDSGVNISGLTACARRSLIFADGFESGDTSAW